jgi:hypothetical protein
MKKKKFWFTINFSVPVTYRVVSLCNASITKSAKVARPTKACPVQESLTGDPLGTKETADR